MVGNGHVHLILIEALCVEDCRSLEVAAFVMKLIVIICFLLARLGMLRFGKCHIDSQAIRKYAAVGNFYFLLHCTTRVVYVVHEMWQLSGS